MSVWRIQTNPSKGNIADYCIRNNVAALGWCLKQTNLSESNGLTFEEYEELAAKEEYKLDSVNALAKGMQPNDLIWLRKSGKYYLARVTNESHWQYNNSDEAYSLDACNQRTDIKWIEIGDESDVPGALTTAFIRGQALQHINTQGILEYSELIYDKKTKDAFRYNRSIELNKDSFYSLISPSDCEDLLYIYSYKLSNYRYVCIPSTNKIATQTYEFVAIDRETGKHIYYQAKNGNIDLNTDDYYKLIENSNSDEVYLLTTRGNVFNEKKYNRIHVINSETIFNFCFDDKNEHIIPPNIRYWIEFAGGYNVPNGKKGIMFDVNDDDCEKYMFENKVVAAWGASKRYVDSFNKGDYVFYYKKGYGIIAIGEINGKEPVEIENGKQYSVRMISDPEKTKDGEYISLYPSDIKSILNNKMFYFASTQKRPFLDQRESELLISRLKTLKNS